MELTGRCICGAVRYRISEGPLVARSCWCRDCQYIAGGSSTVNAIFKTDAIALEGELKEYVTVADSGNVMHWKFCPSCGTHVLATSDRRPHLTVLRIGTLDDREAVRPGGTIWTSSAPSWALIDPNLPQELRQPPPPTPRP